MLISQGDDMEEQVKMILQKHNCKFITMLSECRVLWQNQNGIVRDNDIFTLRNMPESAWKFWEQA